MKNGAALLDAVAAFYRRFVKVSDEQATVIALWTVHTHAIAAATTTPYLAVTSPEKQSGKTRLLEVGELLVPKPWLTGRVTAACLVRKIDQQRPTLLLDESDAAFNGDKEYAEALRGVLNTGHRRGGQASCCVGQGANVTFKDFQTFCPKVIAGIGRLPDTVADRSISIRLKRKAPGEGVSRFRRRDVEPEAKALRARITEWTSGQLDHLSDARPVLPESITDRQQDGAEPLLAIADAAGGEWPSRARRAIVDIFSGAASADGSHGVRLLSDIRAIFDESAFDRMTSADLITKLVEIETSPWSEWSHGKPITVLGLSRLLKPFDVTPKTIRVADTTPRGYLRESFEDAWTRYLPSLVLEAEPDPQHPQHCSNHAGKTQFSDPQHDGLVAGEKNEESSMFMRVVADATDQIPDQASQEDVADQNQLQTPQGDYLFGAAVSLCREAGSVSVTSIKNVLMVSAATAVRYVDQMQKLGLVGPANGSGPRPFRAVN